MNLTRFLLVALLMAGFGLGGCGDSDDPPPPAPPPPPPLPEAVEFTQFVKDQFAATDETSDPVPVDNTDFAFNDQDNPDAFDDLLDDAQ